MSGVVSGLGKVFQTVGSAAARVSSAVMGVGKTVFTAGAAAGAPSMASGGFTSVLDKLAGTGVLRNVLTGAVKQAGVGALVGGGIGALTGQGFGKGALIGGLGGAVTGGLGGLANAARIAPPGVDTSMITGSVNPSPAVAGTVPAGGPAPLADGAFDSRFGSSATPPPVGAVSGPLSPDVPAASAGGWGSEGGGGGGFWQFMQSPMGGNLVAGLGQGLAAGMAAKERREAEEADRQFLLDREQRLRDSYSVDPSVLHSPVAPDASRPAPSSKYFGRPRYQFDPAAGMIVTVPA